MNSQLESEPGIGGWLRRHHSERPDRRALRFEDGREWSYAELDLWSDAIASLLSETHAIDRGDRIAFLGTNNPAMVALLFACARLGAILVPLNWRLTVAELAFIVQDCGPKVLVGEKAFSEAAKEISTSQSACELIPVERLDNSARSHSVASVDQGRLSDPLLIVYTSGTTGRPKGAVLSQQALLTNAQNSVDLHELGPDDEVLVVLPLFHVGGLNITLTPALFVGAGVILQARFDPARTLACLQQDRPDILVLVPATMVALLGLAGWAEADCSSLRMLTTGSMIVLVDLIAAYEAKGISVVQVYGSTETSPIAAYSRPGEGKSNPQSTGKAALHSEIRIVDEQGQPLREAGQAGEIEVRGTNVMQGYWGRDLETAEAFNDGWFRSGDIGLLDAEGNLRFLERRSQMIVSGGENIYPAEIERVLAGVPGIAEVAVCGLADLRWGEVPAAAVVLEPDLVQLPQEAIDQALQENLARFKHPKHLIQLPSLPRNAMGKVVHDDLRACFQSI